MPKKIGKMRNGAPRNRRHESARPVLGPAILAQKITHFRQYRNLRAKELMNRLRRRQMAMTTHPETPARTNPKWMRCDAFYMHMEVWTSLCLFPVVLKVQIQGGYYFGSVDQERSVFFECFTYDHTEMSFGLKI